MNGIVEPEGVKSENVMDQEEDEEKGELAHPYILYIVSTSRLFYYFLLPPDVL